MFPFHIWLPEAHVEAPTIGSVILASLLLKLGGYGFLRFLLPIFPEVTVVYLPLVHVFALLGIIYASLVTLRQVDLKRIIAYSSVAHMNLAILGLFSGNLQGIQGAIVLMLAHGVVSGALFFLVGVLYVRYHTRSIEYFSGIVQEMPIFSIFFIFFSLSNCSVPCTFNFVGEILIFVGVFQQNTTVCFIAMLSVVLGAIYSLWLCNRVCFGTVKKFNRFYLLDINKREFHYFLPLIFLTVFMGIYPKSLMSFMYCTLQFLLTFIVK
jgi:proton-translocating NADH-quinone oxidoreductase chain M